MLKKLLVFLSENRQEYHNKIDFSQVKSILLRPLGKAIGDAVVHTAHLSQIRQILPHVKIGVIVDGANQTIFEHCGLVDEFIPRNINSYLKNYKRWDLLLDFENNFNSSALFMDRILMPRWIMNFYKYNKKYYNLDNIKNYDYHFDQEPTARLSHYLVNSIFSEKFDLPEPYSIIYSNQLYKKDKQNNKIKILLCPQGSKREIPVSELALLLNSAIKSHLLECCEFIVSYTDNSLQYTEKLILECPCLAIQPSQKTTLPEYFSLIENSDFVIAVDGGSLHLACAFKKPLLSFFANNKANLNRWMPLVYPNVPHFMILTKEDHGSNCTKNFDLTEGITWLTNELTEYKHGIPIP
ncbi:glycosyltransferase family 9 protein [Actinobacillus equuli]|uniref:glycosyltransferase family 9 protein n=1 Tax=Actinobacillus equuli TaxID=718 RepID=UPI00241872AF|nr:glycosyltransferase family 9 protein [Actinobacillus equuli]MDG4951948.1 lipopolysaccharide heptosyltransferase family protein [Actinobacillus equuli subsp. equuli]WGE83911.1 lipopolysaccharide heptosyltransferase family protein [Actinobacillus equuli subsp. equuli]